MTRPHPTRRPAPYRGPAASVTAAAVVVLLLAYGSVHAETADNNEDEAKVRVARLIYGGGKTSQCFAAGFLETVDRETPARVHREFDTIQAGSDDLFRYPFVIMTGEGAFELTDEEVEKLREYVNRGGLLLASAGCSDVRWADSFRVAFRKIFPQGQMAPVATDHRIFSTLYEIEGVNPKRATDKPGLHGYSVGDRLAVIFSPLGLNDTENAGGGCCCCGGNEIRNARFINANILVYALTQ